MTYGTHKTRRKVRSQIRIFRTHPHYLEKVRASVGPAMAAYVEQVYQTYDWKVPKHIIKHPSKLPAITTPLPGTSYNPTYDDHQVRIIEII